MKDEAARLAVLRELARSAPGAALPPVSLDMLGAALLASGDTAEAERVLRQAQHNQPGDVWLNYDLAQALKALGRPEEMIRYYMAARSLRPETAHELAHELEANGEIEEAVSIFRDLAQRRPKVLRHFNCLRMMLQSHGRTQEGEEVLDTFLASNRQAISLKPDDARAHAQLALALLHKGDFVGAVAEAREARRLNPDLKADVGLHEEAERGLNSEAAAIFGYEELARGNDLDVAMGWFRAANSLRSDDVKAHAQFALARQRDLDATIAASRAAVLRNPDLAEAHCNLGHALRQKGEYAESRAEFEKGHELGSRRRAGLTRRRPGLAKPGILSILRMIFSRSYGARLDTVIENVL